MSFLRNVPEASKNLGLFWDKYSFFKHREYFINDKQNLAPVLIKDLNIEDKVLEILNSRRDSVVQTSDVVLDLKASLNTRLLVGSGNPSPTEVGMTFSRNYGVPVIPGSALKGCFSHYLKERGDIFDADFRELFGEELNGSSEDNVRGSLIFLDAIPLELKLGLDIVNNHFQPYYMEKQHPPNDWYNPVPVIYIVVESGRFRFTILADRNKEKKLSSELKKKLSEEFKSMLKTYGIGAKTNYGYGRFSLHSRDGA